MRRGRWLRQRVIEAFDNEQHRIWGPNRNDDSALDINEPVFDPRGDHRNDGRHVDISRGDKHDGTHHHSCTHHDHQRASHTTHDCSSDVGQ